MIKVHVISDFYLPFIEFSTETDVSLPECDLVVIAGNMGQIKRVMVYVESLCRKYPDKQFIFNTGRTEDGLHQKNNTEMSDGLTNRQSLSNFWPKNLHYGFQKPISLTINDQKIEVLCFHGFPYIAEDNIDDSIWKSTQWYKYATHGVTYDQKEFKHKDAADIYHGWFPKFSTVERCREDHDLEYDIVKQWLNNAPSDVTKILVTALFPKNDPCLEGIDYTMYPGINPDVWIASGRTLEDRTNNYVLYGNPGREQSAREAVLMI